jgi:hypothetical protein
MNLACSAPVDSYLTLLIGSQNRLDWGTIDQAQVGTNMSPEIKESDWKVLRELLPIALERFSGRVLDEIRGITSTRNKSAHDRFVDTSKLIQKRKREMADAFDDLRRSTAFLRLLAIQSHELLTNEEMERFSPEMRERLRSLLE